MSISDSGTATSPPRSMENRDGPSLAPVPASRARACRGSSACLQMGRAGHWPLPIPPHSAIRLSPVPWALAFSHVSRFSATGPGVSSSGSARGQWRHPGSHALPAPAMRPVTAGLRSPSGSLPRPPTRLVRAGVGGLRGRQVQPPALAPSPLAKAMAHTLPAFLCTPRKAMPPAPASEKWTRSPTCFVAGSILIWSQRSRKWERAGACSRQKSANEPMRPQVTESPHTLASLNNPQGRRCHGCSGVYSARPRGPPAPAGETHHSTVIQEPSHVPMSLCMAWAPWLPHSMRVLKPTVQAGRSGSCL
eukprot:XP_024305060.1 uncharacterized protein LOC112268102 [Homo sapiens]